MCTVRRSASQPCCAAGALRSRARGQLCRLVLIERDYAVWRLLWPVLRANAGFLRELNLQCIRADHVHEFSKMIADALLSAAPLLQVLTAEDAFCTWEDAPQILRGEPPFALLQLRSRLVVHFHDVIGPGGMERVAPFSAALADVTLQPALMHICIKGANFTQPAVTGALVDAVLARRLRELTLENCTPPAAAPLARLLAEGLLTSFAICSLQSDFRTPLFDAAGATLVADALRVNTTLTKLALGGANLCVDMGVAGTLLSALVGHPSLREFQVHSELITGEDCSAFGAALAALVAADSPALHAFVCLDNELLGDAGLAPIVEALAHRCSQLVRQASQGCCIATRLRGEPPGAHTRSEARPSTRRAAAAARAPRRRAAGSASKRGFAGKRLRAAQRRPTDAARPAAARVARTCAQRGARLEAWCGCLRTETWCGCLKLP